LVILAILIGVVGILTIGRAEFAAAAAVTGFEGLLSSVGDKVATSGGLLGALRQALADTSALVLVSVNVTSILVAFLLGYFAHDPDKHFDKAFERLRSATRALERHDRRFKHASNRAREQARARLDEINSLYTNATAAIVTQKTSRGMTLGDEDRFALPELDRLLKGLRSQRHFTYEDVAPASDGASPADVVENLINAGGNVTRVGLRDTK
jgi:hypothetical protein